MSEEIRVRLGVHAGAVLILFSTDVAWLALSPSEARAHAQAILEKVAEIEAGDPKVN